MKRWLQGAALRVFCLLGFHRWRPATLQMRGWQRCADCEDLRPPPGFAEAELRRAPDA